MKDKKFLIFFLIALTVVLLDQLSKYLFGRFMSVGESIRLLPFFELTLTHNSGAGFSLLSGQTGLLIWVSVIVIGVILYFFDKIPEGKALVYTAILFGGTIGNLIDRIAYGYVIDFIDLGFWPVFNLADSCIFIGAILLGIYVLGKDRKDKKQGSKT